MAAVVMASQCVGEGRCTKQRGRCSRDFPGRPALSWVYGSRHSNSSCVVTTRRGSTKTVPCGDVIANCRGGFVSAHRAGLHGARRQPERIGRRHMLGAFEIDGEPGAAQFVPQVTIILSPLLAARGKVTSS